MSFTNTEKASYDKILLVRITHREIFPSMTSQGSGIYTAPMSRILKRVFRNSDIVLSEDTLPLSSDDTYNLADGVLTVKLASAPNTSNNIVGVDSYLLYTNEKTRVISLDPEDDLTDLAEWEPRVVNVPVFKQSVKNTLNGILSTSGSNIDIINSDRVLDSLIGDYQSFSNREVEMWIAFDDTSNMEKVYVGYTKSLILSRDKVTFSIADPTTRLDDIAYMGDSSAEAVHSLSVNTTLNPIFDDSPNRFYVGSASRNQLTPFTTSLPGTEVSRASSLDLAVDTSFSDVISTTSNRELAVGRSSNGVSNTVRTLSSITGGGFGFDFIILNYTNPSSNNSLYNAGQFVSISSGAKERVIKVGLSDTSVVLSWDPATASPAVSDIITGHGVTIYIKNIGTSASTIYLDSTSDFTTSNTATSGGNFKTTVSLTNNFEAGYAEFGGLPYDPNINTAVFLNSYNAYVPAADPITHADVIKDMVEKSGVVDIDSATFTQADIDVLAKCRFSIPYFDETQYGSYRNYIERLLVGTGGIIYTTPLGIAYKILEFSSSSEVATSDSIVLSGTSRIRVEYEDVSDQYIPFNPHSPAVESGIISLLHRLLHDVRNPSRVIHSLEDAGTQVNFKAKLARNRRLTYVFDLFSEKFEKSPGDTMVVGHKNIIAEGPVTIVGTSKSSKKISLVTLNILDL